LDSYREYRQLLDGNAEEYTRLISALTVNVTEFFRDKPVWESFTKRVVPDLLNRKAARNQHLVRIWCAGCSGGEEPYTVALITHEATSRSDFPFSVSVYASDIDTDCLERARAAVYPNKELSSIPAHYRSECVSAGEGKFTFTKEIRSQVRFRRLDLFADKPIAAVDAIFCRNVLIYFDRAQQERIFDSFHSALNRGGYLIIGMSEKIGGASVRQFETVSGREKIYRRRD